MKPLLFIFSLLSLLIFVACSSVDTYTKGEVDKLVADASKSLESEVNTLEDKVAELEMELLCKTEHDAGQMGRGLKNLGCDVWVLYAKRPSYLNDPSYMTSLFCEERIKRYMTKEAIDLICR